MNNNKGKAQHWAWY